MANTKPYTRYTRRNGWERYGMCVLFEIDGVVQHALYLNDRTGKTRQLYPHKVKTGKANNCYSILLRQGYYILYDPTYDQYYDHENGCMADMRTYRG